MVHPGDSLRQGWIESTRARGLCICAGPSASRTASFCATGLHSPSLPASPTLFWSATVPWRHRIFRLLSIGTSGRQALWNRVNKVCVGCGSLTEMFRIST
jgi:hypothetical protein